MGKNKTDRMSKDVGAISASIKETAIEFLYRDGSEVVHPDDIVLVQLGVASMLTDLFCALEKIGLQPKKVSASRFVEMLMHIVNEVEQQEITN